MAVLLDRVLRNPNTSTEALNRLCQAGLLEDGTANKWLLRHPSCPLGYLETAMRMTVRQRRFVASNDVLPEHIARQLAQSTDLSIQRRMADNDSCPIDLLWELATHKDDVGSVARDHLLSRGATMDLVEALEPK